VRSLITGAGGFAGQHLAALLLSRPGEEVFGTARRAIGWQGPDLSAQERFRVLSADLAAPDQVAASLDAAQPDFVYLLAGRSAPAESFSDPMGTIVDNVGLIVNVLEAIRKSAMSPRILLVSSAEVYGRSRHKGVPIAEAAPLAPDNPYAVSKVAQDLLGYQYGEAYGLDVVRVRPFNHFGPGQSDRFVASAFARQIVEAELHRRPPVIDVGSLEPVRDFTDVRDMVRAYELALAKGQRGDVYNLARGQGRSIQSLLDGLIARSRISIEVRFDPKLTRPSDSPILIGDPSRFVAQTGWAPDIAFEQTLEDVLNDWRSRAAA
jgi:GDP-4-dehydro-6-deoxy-D-mannose reductase